jgi:hypothetical protein
MHPDWAQAQSTAGADEREFENDRPMAMTHRPSPNIRRYGYCSLLCQISLGNDDDKCKHNLVSLKM